jgi:hypothetical protein
MCNPTHYGRRSRYRASKDSWAVFHSGISWNTWDQASKFQVVYEYPTTLILQAYLYHLFNTLEGAGVRHAKKVVDTEIMSKDLPFSPLVLAAEVWATATCADDSGIDLSTWSFTGEMDEHLRARQVPHWFVIRWWTRHKNLKEMEWLSKTGCCKADVWGVEDCLRHTEACLYFKWVRGSWIFFWCLPAEWQEEFQDGVKIWEIPGHTLPVDKPWNAKGS